METTEKTIECLKNMINSCFTYGSADPGSYYYDKYILPYKQQLPEDVFETEYKNHLDHLKANATIEVNVYTDCEGLTYNNLIINV